jgi:hypothetical protein
VQSGAPRCVPQNSLAEEATTESGTCGAYRENKNGGMPQAAEQPMRSIRR